MGAVTKLRARLDIETVFTRHAHTIDSYDGPGRVDYLTPDGIFEATGDDGSPVRFVGTKH